MSGQSWICTDKFNIYAEIVLLQNVHDREPQLHLPHLHKNICTFRACQQVSHILRRIRLSFADNTREDLETVVDDLDVYNRTISVDTLKIDFNWPNRFLTEGRWSWVATSLFESKSLLLSSMVLVPRFSWPVVFQILKGRGYPLDRIYITHTTIDGTAFGLLCA